MADLPTVVTAAGLQPVPPATIRADLVAAVAQTNPGYTDNLPGSLIEDVASTEVAGISLIDQARVDAVNSLTPLGANAFLLLQLGQMLGIPLGVESNTSVNVVFSAAAAGFVIAQGFTVSDGTYLYVVQDGGIIGASLQSQPLFALATVAGSWAIPAGTVTRLITSVPSGVALTVTNPQPGTAGGAAQTMESYRSQVLQANLAGAQGMPRFLKTIVALISGVQPRLISVLQSGANWEIIVGGGDPFQVAYAIFRALFNVNSLAGSTLAVTGITNANPGVVTTNLNHGYASGQACAINGLVGGMTPLNGVAVTATVIDEKRFSIGVDTTAYVPYSSGGVVTPNLRNVSPTINDFPNTYTIPFVAPPQQSVAMTVSWNTTANNFVSEAAVAQLGAPALADYVNAIFAGQPMNLFELQAVFQAAVAAVLPPQLLTRMVFAVSINGVGVAPTAGTGIIAGDPESYFLTDTTHITILQG